MTNAESIVREYLERGYSPEALRLLAESRGQPLCAEMLAVIEALAANGDIRAAAEDSGPCETAAYPVARDEAESVFFVAGDEEAASEEGAVDFDVMAETAENEESVADIFVGETAGADVVALTGESASGEGGDAEAGIWSRLWSRVSGPPALAPSVLGRGGDTLAFEDDGGAETAPEEAAPDGAVPLAEASASDAVCEKMAVAVESVSDALVERVAENVSEAPVAGTADTEVPVAEEVKSVDSGDEEGIAQREESEPEAANTENEPVADAESVAPTMETEEPEVPGAQEDPVFADDIAAQSEISADYIPGSVSDLYDNPGAALADEGAVAAAKEEIANDEAPREEAAGETAAEAPADPSSTMDDEIRRLGEAQAAIAAAAPEVESETLAAGELTEEAFVPSVSAILPIPAAPEAVVDNRQESRRERRRRERAEKKRQKKSKKKPAADALPEIVLTRSEGTETMSVACDVPTREFAVAGPEAETAAAEPGTENVEESAETPRMSEPMSLLTPNDVIEDDSQIAEESSAVSAVAEADADAAAEISPETEDAVAEPESVPEAADDPSLFYSGDDHLMIIAGGGVTGEECAVLVAANATAETGAASDGETEQAENNVILFSEKFPVFAGVRAEEVEDYDDDMDGGASYPVLRMLPPVEEEAVREADTEDGEAAAETALIAAAAVATPLLETSATAEEAVSEPEAPKEDYLGDAARLALVRAMLGVGPLEIEDCLEESGAEETGGHVIVSQEPEPEQNALEREAAVRGEMEREYQIRLDEFAARLLDVQGVAAGHKARLQDKKAELDAKSAVIGEMQKRLDEDAGKYKKLANALEDAIRKARSKEEEVEQFKGMRDEHQRLYKEFEDLRRAYNEVVTDVMPNLQNERDDLALTVERQCANEGKLRSSLGSARKRLAVGYSLAGAACLALVALPVANWLKSGQDDKRLAMEHQKITELQDTLQREVQQNINSQNVIVELENKVEMARAQIQDLQGKNKELARVSSRASAQPSQGLAVFRPPESGSTGVPARASEMALQAGTPSSGRLHVNEIRDPVGSIEQTYAMNRQQQPQQSRQMAQSPRQGTRPIAVSAVGRTDGQTGGGLRPRAGVAVSAATSAPAAGARPQNQRAAASVPSAREGEILAKVKKGEGVAQVVYRELGTWDPEVVAWVIRENKITNDKRGNPRIHPDQVLRLPKGGRVDQAASAARRR